MPIRGDFAFVKAHLGDTEGNLRYHRAARNFNPVVATASEHTIAEVETLVEPGSIDPDQVITPGVYVNTIFQGTYGPKRIEKRTNRPKSGARA
jgi:3-oxoacid CoA-transferase subunit A